VFGPEKRFGVVNGERGEDAASVQRCGGDGSDARLGRLHHGSVQRYDGMQEASLSNELNRGRHFSLQLS